MTTSGDLARPPSGYLLGRAAARLGLELTAATASTGSARERRHGRPRDGRPRAGARRQDVPGLRHPEGEGRAAATPTTSKVFLKEYEQFVKDKNMPRFIVMSLGEDHTDGTTPGAYTPQACVASNDLAAGATRRSGEQRPAVEGDGDLRDRGRRPERPRPRRRAPHRRTW